MKFKFSLDYKVNKHIINKVKHSNSENIEMHNTKLKILIIPLPQNDIYIWTCFYPVFCLYILEINFFWPVPDHLVGAHMSMCYMGLLFQPQTES